MSVVFDFNKHYFSICDSVDSVGDAVAHQERFAAVDMHRFVNYSENYFTVKYIHHQFSRCEMLGKILTGAER